MIAPLDSFDSGSSGRDSNMLFYTESNKYPFVKFTSNSFNMKSIVGSDNDLLGVLEFHGIKDTISSRINILNKGFALSGVARFSISLDHYNVDKPQLLFVPISDNIDVECHMFCENDFLNFNNEKK